jgi:hypothetical protein
MKRRTVVASLSGAMAWPLVGFAQQSPSTKRFGILMGLEEGPSWPSCPRQERATRPAYAADLLERQRFATLAP